MRNQLLHPGKLLDDQGYLTETGYATSLVKEYSRADIKAGNLKIKEWDYYLIYNEHYGVALTYADNSYMGLISASVIDFKNKKEKTTSVMTFMPRGRSDMPNTTDQGNITFENKRVRVLFDNDGRRRHLHFVMKQFDGEQDFYADFVLTRPANSDQIVVATPFEQKKTAFYYNTKIIGMNATGHAAVGNHIYSFHEDSQALLDWGRGVWTYKNTWYWSAAYGKVNGRRVGFNLGYGFGDTSKATENAIFYDGKLHKLDDVTFHIPADEKGVLMYEQPWTFTSSNHRFEAVFTPIIDRATCTNLGMICSDQHQVFGRFTGTLVLDDGAEVKLNHFLGFAEKVFNRW